MHIRLYNCIVSSIYSCETCYMFYKLLDIYVTDPGIIATASTTDKNNSWHAGSAYYVLGIVLRQVLSMCNLYHPQEVVSIISLILEMRKWSPSMVL